MDAVVAAMECRWLGRTALRVSRVSLGTVELGLEYGLPAARRPAPPAAARLLHRALDLGINLIDTAPAYGESEEIIGRALRGRRSEVVLATKVEARGGRGRRRRMRRSLERSLRALRTDVIDLLQLHSATEGVLRRGEAWEALRRFQWEGHIRYIGATTYGEAAAKAALDDGRYDCLQVAYNLLDRRLEERVLPLAREKGVGIIARSVLLKGALTRRYVGLPDELGELTTQ
jgi:aryl-alcohol dehydrogenase-like predicted oxidoreductase